MTIENSNDLPEGAQKPVDLNALSSIDFGPSWAGDDRKPSSRKQQKKYTGEQKGYQKKGSTSGGRDRRPARAAGNKNDRSSERRVNQKNGSGKHRNAEAGRNVFEPTVKIDLYPQDEAFDALVKRLQSTARTYQLFEITKLLLEKYERFIVVVSPKNKGGTSKKLYYSVPGHLPFETEEAAVNYVLTNYIDLFFDTEIIEVEPPKGNFQMVNRCPITQELLGPPNYHRYSEFLNRHFTNRISGMSMERYVEKIETIKEQEVIDAWVNSMKESVRYTVKEPTEGEPVVLETLEAARLFLMQNRKASVVGSGESVRFAGRDLKHLPVNDIHRSVESFVEQQRFFPLETANNIRGRLRRHNFTIYKKGAKNASYVCAVKRKFRHIDTVFTESIQRLIDFIEQHSDVKASDLALSYLGIKMPEKQPNRLKLAEQDISNSQSDAEGLVEENLTVAKPSAEEIKPVIEASSQIDENANNSVEPTLTVEQESQLKQLRIDLRWLITEGYVTEYGDGRLFAPMPTPLKNKNVKLDSDSESAKENDLSIVIGETESEKANATAVGDNSSNIANELPIEATPDSKVLVEIETQETPSEGIQASGGSDPMSEEKSIKSVEPKD
ncbi:MAG: Uncharacterised protein [Opitutia bacterium UBA7350]|nr:MAG: Uncharacterised protein [Opitutae bacterium UBA7350]